VKSQIRAWLRVAPRHHLALTALVLGGIVGLIVTSVVPSGTSQRALLAPGGAPPVTPPGGGLTAPGPTPGAIPGTSGSPSAGPGSPLGSPSAGAFPSASPPPGSVSSPSGGNKGPVRLAATDRGVTAKTVKLGFLVVNPGGLDKAGFALGLRGDMEQVVHAYVDYVNHHGGINGRMIDPQIRRTDPTDVNDQKAACKSMLLDRKVFGVSDTATTLLSDAQGCYTIEGKTPFTHSYPLSTGFQAQGGGLDVSANRALDRIAREWAREATRQGFIKGGEKVGYLTEACQPSLTVIQKIFVPALKRAGTQEPVAGITDCDPRSQQSQVPNIVLRMNTQHVTHMFMAANFVAVQNFLTNAVAQSYKPKYFISDYAGLTDDFFTKNFPEDQWDRVHGITTLLFGAKAAGKPMAPGTRFCNNILVAAKVPEGGLDHIENEDAEAAGMCDEFFIMVEALKAVGPNLTRAGWAQAVQRLGAVQTATVHRVVFSPGKTSGGDDIATVEWRRGCKCYIQISGYRAGHY
jgi:ABC-type branched-subunit amino acid transport system substrate-binding protein